MTNPFERDDINFVVVVNAEKQYSLWPESRSIPAGWQPVERGSREACLKWVDEHWLDMRPLSLIQNMEGKTEPTVG